MSERQRRALGGWMKTVLMAGALLLALCGASHATDISFTKDIGAAHLTGTVEVDDSSGDIVSVSGEASGAVSGKYLLSRVDLDAALAGGSSKLLLHFDRRNQQVTAKLDAADPVIVWIKP